MEWFAYLSLYLVSSVSLPCTTYGFNEGKVNFHRIYPIYIRIFKIRHHTTNTYTHTHLSFVAQVHIGMLLPQFIDKNI